MKKIFFMAAVAALALSSCSSTEEVLNAPEQVAENAIAFDVYTNRTVSRALTPITTAINWQGLETKDLGRALTGGFGVYAYETGAIPFDTYVENNSYPNYMFEQQVKVSTVDNEPSAENAFTYTPVKYWPNDRGMVTFQAYAPYTANISAGYAANGTPATAVLEVGKNAVFSTKYNGVGIRYNALDNYDLLWGSTTAADEAYCLRDQTKPEVNEKTTFRFQHALAQLNVNVSYFTNEAHTDASVGDEAAGGFTATDATQEYKIVVRSVRLLGPTPTQGVLSLYDGKWTAEQAEEGVYVINKFIGGAGTDTNELTKDNVKVSSANSILLIPSKNNIEVEVTYDVVTIDPQNGANTSVVTNVVRSNAPVENLYPSLHAWELKPENGKSYHIDIHIGLTSVNFDATVGDWGTPDGSHHEVDLPNNKVPAPVGGDPSNRK